MKKFLAVLILIALAIGGFFLFNLLLQPSPWNISQIDITDLETRIAQTYHPDTEAAASLTAGLKGQPVQAQPASPYKAYELILRHVWGFEKVYMVCFDDDTKVFLEDMKTKKLISVDESDFFYSYEGFDSLYPYRSHPRVEWSSLAGTINIQAADITWSYRKWDGKWYTGSPEPSGGNETVKIHTPDTALSFQSDYTPDSVYVEVLDEAKQTVLKQEVQNSSLPVIGKDGIYSYLVEMNWSQPENPYKGTYSYRFQVSVDLPASFEISGLTVLQGDVIKVYAYHVNENEKPVLNQKLSNNFTFYKNGDTYMGYLPTGYSTAPGSYELEYGIEGGDMFKETLTIEARRFHIQHLVIDAGIEASTRNEAAYAEYDKYFVPVRKSSSQELYYWEPFAIPAAGRLSTEYGETRHVNGSPTSYRHSGLDIAAPKGTPVYAVNRGKVVLSMFLTLTGNTIVIDHGQGLFSVYFHMNELLAEQGGIVDRGEKIATVGTTGFSTGPHLHFTMSYFDRNIEPGYFLVGEPITRSNYKDYLK